MSDRSEIRESRKATVIGTMAGWLMRLWCATLRFDIEDRAGLAPDSPPVVFALWHNRIFSVPDAWRRIDRSGRRTVVLTSASHDGAMLARAVAVFGLGSVRGSSSRRGVAALVALRKALKSGTSCCVTPDGPRGPRYVVQPGIIKIAEATGAPIIPVHAKFSAAWRLRSWDRFVVPKPFSRVRVIFDAALAVPAGLGEDDFETQRVALEKVLLAGVDDLSQQEP